jgi:hypothetical protein
MRKGRNGRRTMKDGGRLGTENDVITVQDENIAEWQSSKMKKWGRRIQQFYYGRNNERQTVSNGHSG